MGFGGPRVVFSSTDPTGGTVFTDAPVGTILLYSVSGSTKVYQRNTTSVTDWVQLGGGSSDVTISPTALAFGSSTDNYSPTGASTANIWRISSGVGGTCTVTGISKGQVDGTTITLININSAVGRGIIFTDEDASSTAANRIITPGNIGLILGPGCNAVLRYDGTTARWRVTARATNWNANGSLTVPSVIVGVDKGTGFYYDGSNMKWITGSDFVARAGSANLTVQGFTAQGFATQAGISNSSTWSLSGDNSATIAANQNNYNPSGLSSCAIQTLDNTSGGNVDITGLFGGSDGRTIIIRNISASALDTITLKNESGSSTAGNRFTLPSGIDQVLPVGGTATVTYDVSTTRWFLSAKGF